MMDNAYHEAARLLAYDPGRRHVPVLACPRALYGATWALARAQRVVLLSGFYIGHVGAWETDGPLGTLVLAAACQRAGIHPVIYTDTGALPIFTAAMQSVNWHIDLLGFPPGEIPCPQKLLAEQRPDALVAIERTGRASNKCYYNAGGMDVSSAVAHFDSFFQIADEAGIATIAVGDGGNELGFGSRWRETKLLLGEQADIVCMTPSRHLIACGVSNWGGYALAALLARHKHFVLTCNEKMLNAMLTAMVAAGAVDGVSGLQVATVDGLPLAVELDMFTRLLDLQPTMIRVAR